MASACAISGPDGTGNSALLCTSQTTVLHDAVADNCGEEMRARYVHIRKVGAVRLVEVVIGFEERSTSGCDYRLEKGMGRDSSRLQVDLVRQGAEEA